MKVLLLFLIIGVTVSVVVSYNLKPPVKCPSPPGKDDLFPNPYDCKTYYHCANEIPFLMECPDNLHFNPKIKVCDYPGKAGCQAQDPDPGITTQPTPDPSNGTTESNEVCSCSCEKYKEVCG